MEATTSNRKTGMQVVATIGVLVSLLIAWGASVLSAEVAMMGIGTIGALGGSGHLANGMEHGAKALGGLADAVTKAFGNGRKNRATEEDGEDAGPPVQHSRGRRAGET